MKNLADPFDGYKIQKLFAGTLVDIAETPADIVSLAVDKLD